MLSLRILIIALIYSFIIQACSNSDSEEPQSQAPIVRSLPSYDVIIEEGIVYAQGLSHESINSEVATTVDLTLDIYRPDNNSENRPVFMFIHGGGFKGGSSIGSNAINLGNFYASRGWVFISINYRLEAALGTVPEEWVTYSQLFTDGDPDQFLAIYPALRDAKAAMRWIVKNAPNYNINTDYITVGGGSAGAINAITLGISELQDYRDEINTNIDPTLLSTNLDQTYVIKTIVDFWGSKVGVDIVEEIYGVDRFDSNDPPLFIAHGTEDPTVLYSSATDLKMIYDALGVPIQLVTLEGAGHGPWLATVNGKRLEELALEFIVEQQKLELN